MDPRGASPRCLVEQARIPERNIAARRRRTVGIDNRDCAARQLPKGLGGIADGGRREQQLGRGSVERSAATQASNHVRDVAAKDTAIDVSLVDDDRAEARQPLIPPLMVRADADVDHVRIAEDEIRLDASPAATRGVRIAIDQRHPQVATETERVQATGLILRKRLRWCQIQRARVRLGQQRLEHRHGVGKSLAAGCARGDAHVLARASQRDRLGLMRPEVRDTRALQRGHERRRQVGRERLGLARNGRLLATKNETVVVRWRAEREGRIPTRAVAHGASGCSAAGNDPKQTSTAERLRTSSSARMIAGSSWWPSMSIKNW